MGGHIVNSSRDHRGHTLQSCSSGQVGLMDLDLLGVRAVTRADRDLPPPSCLYLFSPCFLSLCFSSLDFCEQSPASVSLSLHSAAPFHGGSLSLFQHYSLSFGIFEQIQGFSRDLPCPALQPPHSHDGDIASSIRCPCSQWTQSLALPAWGLGAV